MVVYLAPKSALPKKINLATEVKTTAIIIIVRQILSKNSIILLINDI